MCMHLSCCGMHFSKSQSEITILGGHLKSRTNWTRSKNRLRAAVANTKEAPFLTSIFRVRGVRHAAYDVDDDERRLFCPQKCTFRPPAAFGG